MPKAVVLLSGGLDSATVLGIARSTAFDCYALTLTYGQRHSIEVSAARQVAQAMDVVDHKILQVPLDAFGGSALTANIEVPKDRRDQGEIPITYVPARNTVFLAMALAYAESIGAWDIFCGVNAVDYSGYPDCRPEFIASFQDMARLATKIGVEGVEITIHAPLIHMTKPQIIQEGLRLGVDYGLTHSCYDPSPSGKPCAHCDSCLIRIQAFHSLGMEDPALVRV
jgi:7-cyano-7-deazaguanine synthase